MHDFGTIRTYGYPLFLYALSFLSGWSFDRLAAVAGGVQWILYAGATLWLGAALRRVGEAAALGAVSGLLLLPLGLALVTDVLTEGLSLPIAVALAALAVQASGRYRPVWSEAALVAGAMLAALALMVRPGNLPVTIGWHLAVALALVVSPAWSGVRRRLAACAILSFVGAGLLVWGPQAAYAARSVGEWAILPACRLGAFQGAYGILVWKYDTIMTVSGGTARWNLPAPWNTINPFFTPPLPAGGWLEWYLAHPVQGAATLLGHVFMGFNARTPFTYIYDLWPSYAWLHRAAVFSILVFGLWRMLSLLRRAWPAQARAWALPVTFVVAVFLGSCILNAVTAVETRFAAIPMAILACLAAGYGWAIVRGEETLPIRRALASLAVVALLLAVSAWAEQFEGRVPAVQIGLQDYGQNTPCYLTFDTANGEFERVFLEYEKEISRRDGM
ncbi:hypothetical protein [Azospirillum rugosum]|uniref:Nitrate reductase NapE component n=2 Tax=Azospirillum rugosum TaxID=416170 RepID=A0ABS4SQ67_9PROT|nr:hypothetical protein [Azospirillum rugosum]MBP2294379.1 nitrate reductase NapE component [Azospirillum rugosum]MDQ0527714.1 nitrate reductase NapE component [Azospirillum rugosum]